MSDFIKGFMASLATDKDKIRVKRIYIDINDGNLYDGVLFSQIMYWNEPSKTGAPKLTVFKDGHHWLAKQLSDWWDECRIKESTAKQCINRMVDRGLLFREYWRYDGKRMQHLRINFERFEELLKEYSDIAVRHLISDRSDISYLTGQTSHIRPITETTAETTTQTPPIPPTIVKAKVVPEAVTPAGGLDFKSGDRVETPKAGHGTITAVNRDTITVTLDSGRIRDFMPDILTRPEKPAPASATHPGASLITAFIETTNAAKTGVDTKTNRGIADDLAGKGITSENIKAYLEHIASQEWRSNKIPSWFSMAKDLPAWVEESIATVKADEARRKQQAREQEERLAKLNAPSQVTAEELLELKAYRRKVFAGDVDELKDSA